MRYVKDRLSLQPKQGISDSSEFHIAFTGTANYIPWIGVAMVSILQHNMWGGERCHFHILADTIEKKDLAALQEVADTWGIPIDIYYMNDEYLSQFARFHRYFIGGRYLPALLYRFMIPDIISENIQRILYLDGDIVCNGNVVPLICDDMRGNTVTAVSDIQEGKFAKRLSLTKYFNSGVLLIDAQRWREQNLTESFLQYMKKEADEHPELPCPDQDILNIVLHEQTLFADQCYNLQYRLVQPSLFKERIHNGDAMQASLIHFIGAIKPWTTYNQCVPIVKVWAAAKAASPWKDVPLHQPTSQKAIHQAARDARRRGCWGEMLSWYIRFIKSKFDGTPTVGY